MEDLEFPQTASRLANGDRRDYGRVQRNPVDEKRSAGNDRLGQVHVELSARDKIQTLLRIHGIVGRKAKVSQIDRCQWRILRGRRFTDKAHEGSRKIEIEIELVLRRSRDRGIYEKHSRNHGGDIQPQDSVEAVVQDDRAGEVGGAAQRRDSQQRHVDFVVFKASVKIQIVDGDAQVIQCEVCAIEFHDRLNLPAHGVHDRHIAGKLDGKLSLGVVLFQQSLYFGREIVELVLSKVGQDVDVHVFDGERIEIEFALHLKVENRPSRDVGVQLVPSLFSRLEIQQCVDLVQHHRFGAGDSRIVHDFAVDDLNHPHAENVAELFRGGG